MNRREKTPKTLTLTNRKDWRTWLENNHSKETGVWLVYFKKHTGRATIPYDDAVEEALCYGWIDSIVRRIDDEKYMQKFTPRKARSVWSDINKARAKKMIDENKMTSTGMEKIDAAWRSGTWDRSEPKIDAEKIPPDLKKALSQNKKAKKYFDSLAPSYKKQYITWIITAKRDETRSRKIEEAVKKLAQNKKLGLV